MQRPTKIILDCSDEVTLIYKADLILKLFSTIKGLVDDIISQPIIQKSEITLPLIKTSHQIARVMCLILNDQAPTNDKDWLDLLETADYFGLSEDHLKNKVEEYLKTKGAFCHGALTHHDYRSKINDPSFLTQEEKEEEYRKIKANLKRLNRNVGDNGYHTNPSPFAFLKRGS